MRKHPDYQTAIQWIADEDNPGDDESAEDLSAYLTVALVADLFGKGADSVAADVWALRHPRHWCQRCDEELIPSRVVWLELDTNTGLYHDPGDLPASGLSQGTFTFGSACARRELAKTAKVSA